MLKLQPKLIQKLGHTGVELKIVNGSLLQIQVVNAPDSEIPVRSRQEKAIQIARFAYQEMEPDSGLSNISVSFVTRWSFLLFHTQSVDGSVTIPVASLRTGPSRTAPSLIRPL